MPNSYTRRHGVALTEVKLNELSAIGRSRSLPAALALRAWIVLVCEGVEAASTVTKRRGRYAQDQVSGLYDEVRPGRLRTVDDECVTDLINKTLHTKPTDGATHSSTRGSCRREGPEQNSGSLVSEGVPDQAASYGELQTVDGAAVHLEVARLVGLYLNPPENALVLCVDEKS